MGQRGCTQILLRGGVAGALDATPHITSQPTTQLFLQVQFA